MILPFIILLFITFTVFPFIISLLLMLSSVVDILNLSVNF